MISSAAYYAETGLLPSHRALQDAADLATHAAKRQALLCDHLKLPRQVFLNARVGEFGPDTGENALVFAQWGARLWLAEPHEAAHEPLRSYFDHFGLSNQIEHVSATPLELYKGGPFDVLNAEGFVAGLPQRDWIAAVQRLVAPNGVLHISYFERRGMALERTTNALIRLTAAVNDAAPLEAAKTLLAAKWSALGSRRPLASWYLDHCENPLAARSAQLATPDVIAALAAAGFRLHAAAPPAGDPLRVDWPKRERPATAIAEDARRHSDRAALAHALGVPAYWAGRDAEGLGAAVDAVADAAEAVIARPGAAAADGLTIALEALRMRAAFCVERFIAPEGLERPLAALATLAAACRALARGDANPAIAAFNREPLLSLWGTPVHHAVFRRDGAADGDAP